MPRAGRPCSVSGCGEIVAHGVSRCEQHEREADRARGTAAERGYMSRGHQRFRFEVLARNPVCMVCHRAPASVADHYPLSRRELVESGFDPNDPSRGRGLCKQCHDKETARNQPGGWNGG